MKCICFILAALCFGLTTVKAQFITFDENSPLGKEKYYQSDSIIKGKDYTYQCKVCGGLVTLYNAENKYTNKDPIYKDTGKPYIQEGWRHKPLVTNDSDRDAQIFAIIDQAFSMKMVEEIGDQELGINLIVNSDTGEIMEVFFDFVNFRNMSRTPMSVFRSIEVQLKEKIRIKSTELGKKLNFIFIAWGQNPKGRRFKLDPTSKILKITIPTRS